MLHLEKNEMKTDIKKIMRECSNHTDIVHICKEALEAIEKHKDESFKDYLKENYVIAQCFIYTLEKKKNCPDFVIDYVYTMLANVVLKDSSLKEITASFSAKSTWSEHEKMKILQMSFYLVRHDKFCSDLAIDLFNYLFLLVEDTTTQIQTKARPIALQLVDYLLNKIQNKKESLDDQEEITNSESGVVDLDVFVESMKLEKSKSTEFAPSEVVDTEVYAQEALNILKMIYEKRNISSNVSLFYVEALVLISKKENIFKFQGFYDFFIDFVFEDACSKLQSASNPEKDLYVDFFTIICEIHGEIFDIKKVLKVVEEISQQRDCPYTYKFLVSLDTAILEKKEAENILFNILERFNFTTSSSDHLKVVLKLSEFVDSHNSKAFEKYATRLIEIFKETAKINEEELEVKREPKKETTLKVEEANELRRRNEKMIISNILRFCLISENVDMFDTLIQILKDKNLEEFLLLECVKNRSMMAESWELVFDNVKNKLDVVTSNLKIFNDEEVFYIIKSLTSHPNRWSLNDTILIYTSTFETLTPTLNNQDNVKILELYTSSMITLVNSTNNKEEHLQILSRYCQMVLQYVSNIDRPTPHVEKAIGEMLRKILSLNVTLFGSLVLQTLHTLIRIYVPNNWEEIFLIIEMCSISTLHNDLYNILRYVIDKYLNHIGTEQYLILFSCMEDLCSGSDDALSRKVMLTLHEVGECIISKRIVEKADYSIWKTYLTTLCQFTNDGRYQLRDASIRYLFQFISSDSALINSTELAFLIKETLIPLVKSRSQAMDNILADSKLHNSLLILLEELNKHDCLRYSNIEYLEAQLGLVESILKNEMITESQNLIDLSINLLTSRSTPPSSSIQMYQDDYSTLHNTKKNKIQFGKNYSESDEMRDRLFKFYQRLFQDDYPPYVHVLLLDSIRRFDPRVVIQNIKMFDKTLRSNNEVLTNKIITTLLSLDTNDESVLDYLLDYSADSLSLATLIISNCTNKLKRVKTDDVLIKYILKIHEIGTLYECLWEKSLRQLSEASKYIKSPSVFICYVEISKKLFENPLKNEVCQEEASTFQIYTNKQFSHYLDHEPVDSFIATPKNDTVCINRTIEFRKRERLLLNYLVVYHSTLTRFEDEELVKMGFSTILDLTKIKNSNTFNFYNLSFKSYHLLFNSISVVYDELKKILKKVLKNYNEEEKVNNMLFSSIKQKEIYLVFELLIESRNKALIEDLKIEITNCLKNKDFNVVEYVRKNLMILFE